MTHRCASLFHRSSPDRSRRQHWTVTKKAVTEPQSGTDELRFCHTGDSLGHSAGTEYARRRLATRVLENLCEFGKEPIE
ncbi:hypothetical protein ACFLWS_08005 [Chloroflexota bacterium]